MVSNAVGPVAVGADRASIHPAGRDVGMGTSPRIFRAALLAAAAVVLVVAAVQLREKRQTADETVDNIHAQLDALDPVTRAAVGARPTSDEVKKVRG
jgi:hypothetical protein